MAWQGSKPNQDENQASPNPAPANEKPKPKKHNAPGRIKGH